MQIDQVSAGGAEGAGGQAAGTATGMYYDNARFYDPVNGRFLNQDPKGYAAGDPNVYRFVGNDPTEATDPSGMGVNTSGGDVNANGGSTNSSDLMNYVGRTWSATAPDAANTNVSGSQRFPFAPGAAYAGVDLNAAQSSFPGNNYTPTATELSAIALAEQVTQYEAAATKANQAISDYLANNPIPPQFSNTGNFDRPLPDDFVPENLRDAAQYASDTADLANQVYSNLYGSQQWTTPYAQGDVMFGAPDEPSTPAGAIDLVRQANGKWPTAQSVSIVGTAVQVYAVTTGAQAALSLGGTAWSVGTGLVWGSDAATAVAVGTGVDAAAAESAAAGSLEQATALQARAQELNGLRAPWAAENGTTAVANVQNVNTGEIQTWIATNGNRAMPAEWNGLLGNGETFIQGPGHAEQTIVNALGDDWVITSGGSSRNVCIPTCQPLLEGQGLQLGGPIFRGMADKTPYRMFWRQP